MMSEPSPAPDVSLPDTHIDGIIAYLRERDILWFGESEITEKQMREYHKLARAMIAEAISEQRLVLIQGTVVTVFHPFGESGDAIRYTFSENCKVTQTEENVFFIPDEDEESDPDCISISRSGGIMVHVAHRKQILAADVGVSIIRDGQEEKLYQGEDLSKVIDTTITHAPKAVSKAVERVKVPIPTMHAFPSMAQVIDLPVPQPRKVIDSSVPVPSSEDEEG
ncbi:MAG: hypothetical protein ACOY3I_03275 [Verrucomicrobiota bacterium]